MIRQTTSRRKLGHDRLHKIIPPTAKASTTQTQSSTTNLKSPSRKGQGSPSKIRKEANKNIEFECDTSISLSSDDSIIQELKQSPQMPPAKKVDRKTTPPQNSSANKNAQSSVPNRRSTRNITSALAQKFGNAIPINTIAKNTTVEEVCLITVQQNTSEPTGQTIAVHESSTDIECIEISSSDKKPCHSSEKTPEQMRIKESGETGGPTEADTHAHETSPQSSSRTQLASGIDTSTTFLSPNNPQQRAISSRYVIGRSDETPYSPDKSFIDSFNDAMKILQSISPPKNSMTFQREYEKQERPKRPSRYVNEEGNNEPSTVQTPQTSSDAYTQPILKLALDGNDSQISHKDATDTAKDI